MADLTSNQRNANYNYDIAATHILGWPLLSKQEKITGVGEDVEKSEPCTLLWGMQNGTVVVENSMVVFKNIKTRITVFKNLTFGTISPKVLKMGSSK